MCVYSCCLARVLSRREGVRVTLIDPAIETPWRNNYGVWRAEWEALALALGEPLQDCASATGASFQECSQASSLPLESLAHPAAD